MQWRKVSLKVMVLVNIWGMEFCFLGCSWDYWKTRIGLVIEWGCSVGSSQPCRPHCHTATLLHCHTAALLVVSTRPRWACHTAALSHCHTVALPHCHTVTLSHCHTAALSHCYTVTLSHCHTATLSHCHTVALSHCCTPGHQHPGPAEPWVAEDRLVEQALAVYRYSFWPTIR